MGRGAATPPASIRQQKKTTDVPRPAFTIKAPKAYKSEVEEKIKKTIKVIKLGLKRKT